MKVYNENSLVNLSNSILKHFGAETFHDSIPVIDEQLKGYNKVVAVLFDEAFQPVGLEEFAVGFLLAVVLQRQHDLRADRLIRAGLYGVAVFTFGFPHRGLLALVV